MKKAGFTLIEVCISLVILLVVFSFQFQIATAVREQIRVYQFFTEFERLIKIYHQDSVLTSNYSQLDISESKVLFANQYSPRVLYYPKGVEKVSKATVYIKFQQRTGTSANVDSVRFRLATGQIVEYNFKLGKGNYEKKVY